LALVLGPAAGHAQVTPARVLPSLPVAPGPFKPGTWVRYSVYNLQTKRAMQVRIAALEAEGKGQWVEFTITDHRGMHLVLKSLLEGSIGAPKRVLKTVLQPPGHQPVLIPGKRGAAQLPKMRAGTDPKAKRVGKVRVKVAAGTFTAVHYRSVDAKGKVSELWSSDQVPGWPMVKARTPEVVLELADHGTGARTQIVGKPGKLDERLLKKLGVID
jgi:hypothetical protein